MAEENLTFEQLKERGEVAREKGEYDAALADFDRALIIAVRSRDYAGAINVIGHHLHVFDVLFQQTQDPAFMELYYADVLAGLRLADHAGIHGQARSVMFLRAGDYFLFRKDFPEAVMQYKQAIAELDKTSSEAPDTHAEYMGHYGFALVKSGNKTGLGILQQALEKIRNSHTLRAFHRTTIESGILLRLADASTFLGQIDVAKQYLMEAGALADKLANEYNMEMRQRQVRKLALEIGID